MVGGEWWVVSDGWWEVWKIGVGLEKKWKVVKQGGYLNFYFIFKKKW